MFSNLYKDLLFGDRKQINQILKNSYFSTKDKNRGTIPRFLFAYIVQ